jgi:hypothetical protein
MLIPALVAVSDCFKAGCGAPHDNGTVADLSAFNSDISRRVAGMILLFERRVMLLIDDN